MNKLVVLSGVPGSGKSYISLLLKEKKKEGHLYIVSSDSLRTQIGGSQTNFDNESLMWEMYYELASVYSLDKQGIVVLDSTNANTKYRIGCLKNLKQYYDQLILVMFKLDKVTIMRQNLDRDYPIPTDALERLINDFQDITDEDREFYNEIYVVDKHDLSPIIEQIIK
ncbi:MAG: AAA family ATPase [Bacilli bacterium]|nr:AAA family ATPase [Bacilli bacterium]